MDKPKPKLGGISAVADLLNHMEAADRQRLLAAVAKRDPELATQIEEQLFTFEHLDRLDASTLQLLLRKVPQSILALALRSARDEVQSAVYRNLSVRTANSLREEIAASPARKLSDVTAAQETIIAIARALIKS